MARWAWNELLKRMRGPGIVAIAAGILAGFVMLGGPYGSPAAEDPDDFEAESLDDDKDRGRAYLGVQIREEIGHPEGGARVVKVVDDSPADEAGIQTGDIIVEFDGEVVRGPLALTQRVHAKEPGNRVSVTVIREGERKSLEVELGERSELERWWRFGEGEFAPMPDSQWLDELGEHSREWAEKYKDWQEEHWREWAEKYKDWEEQYGREWAEKYRDRAEKYRNRFKGWRGPFYWRSTRPKLGVQLVETTPELRVHLGGSESAGVLVSKVLPDTPAEEAGIQVGDLILSLDGEEVRTAGDLIHALLDEDGKTIELELVRDGRKRKVQVQMPKVEGEEIEGPRAGLLPSLPPLPAPEPLPAPPAMPSLPTLPTLAPRPAMPPLPAVPTPAPLPALPALPSLPLLPDLPAAPELPDQVVTLVQAAIDEAREPRQA